MGQGRRGRRAAPATVPPRPRDPGLAVDRYLNNARDPPRIPRFRRRRAPRGARRLGELAEYGANAMQVFTKNSNQWAEKPVTPEQAALFREARKANGVKYCVSHDSYLINLAAEGSSPRNRTRRSSARSADATNTGSEMWCSIRGRTWARGSTPALKRVAKAMTRALAGDRRYQRSPPHRDHGRPGDLPLRASRKCAICWHCAAARARASAPASTPATRTPPATTSRPRKGRRAPSTSSTASSARKP